MCPAAKMACAKLSPSVRSQADRMNLRRLAFSGTKNSLCRTADVEKFYRDCSPEKENLCLYGKAPPRSATVIAQLLDTGIRLQPLDSIRFVSYGILAGEPSGAWALDLPAEEVPAELPEPCLGINFARDGMARKEWLALVAVHSDAWLMSVAFYYGAKLNSDQRCGNVHLWRDIANRHVAVGGICTVYRM